MSSGNFSTLSNHVGRHFNFGQFFSGKKNTTFYCVFQFFINQIKLYDYGLWKYNYGFYLNSKLTWIFFCLIITLILDSQLNLLFAIEAPFKNFKIQNLRKWVIFEAVVGLIFYLFHFFLKSAYLLAIILYRKKAKIVLVVAYICRVN